MEQGVTTLTDAAQRWLVITKVGADDEMAQYATNNSCDIDSCENIATRMIECSDYKLFGGWSFACPDHFTLLVVQFLGNCLERENIRRVRSMEDSES
jgi:hypothetical protein